MIHGYFPSGTNVPCLEVVILFHQKVLRSTFILDTGFSGCLKIDRQTAAELGIVSIKEISGISAGGDKIHAHAAYAYVELGGRRMLTDILIASGPQLAGIGLFSLFGCKVVIDCKNRTAHLELAV